MALIQVFAGFVMLGFGGDALVKGAVGVAERVGVSKLFIGLILVGFGTSLPELATSVNAALAGSPQIALGNVLGSNLANILLILGVTAAITPVLCDPQAFRRDAPVLAAATLLAVGGVILGGVGRLAGIAFLIGLASYATLTFLAERRRATPMADILEREAELVTPKSPSIIRSLLFFVLGAAGVLGGAIVMVDGAQSLAASIGIPEAVIGLTVIAIGTSLPELAASIAAARKGETDLAYGNIIGSNIFNILGILGATAAIAPISLATSFMLVDAMIVVFATALLFFFAWTGNRLSRTEGWMFLGLYVLYIGLLVSRSV